MTVLVFHTVSAVLKVKGGHQLSPQRFLKYQDVEIVVTKSVNPVSFLSGSMGEPVIHDCLEAIEATYSSCPDLKDTLMRILRPGPPMEAAMSSVEGTPAQALELAKGKKVNIYTDLRYAFGVVHAHGALERKRTVDKKRSIKHEQEIIKLLEAVQLPEKVAIMHIKAHEKVSSELDEENKLAGRKAKEAAKEQSANLHSSVTMIGTLTAAVCTAYGIGYSGYYLTHLARHLKRVFRGADPESTEARADSPLAPCALGEEAKEEQNDHQPPAVVTPQVELSKTVPLEKEHEQVASSEMPRQPCQTQGELFPAEEQEKQLRQQEEKPQENGQNIETEAQAEPSKAPSDIIVVKRRNKEDMKRIQDLWNRLKPRGDPQNQNCGEELQAELLETQARIKAMGQRVEEEMKLQREAQVEIHILLKELEALQKQVDILTSRLATCNDFQQVTGNEEPQDSCEAQELSQAEVLPVEHDLKMVEENRAPCEEVEHLNKELQLCLQPLEGEKSPWEKVEGSFWKSSFRKSMQMDFGEKGKLT
ncbi:hypothetical protein DUI87_35252 [Hirundo rustica rustica]|uniref:RNase H type-1 domain-containing protein n=1 Tax=Hirundo rustica rustica TaxID=333673 RepID=A0A3M0IHZ1_HIRRU|nr:hypothetical protein DUI87_35252 [Hirundo rustica rustica]